MDLLPVQFNAVNFDLGLGPLTRRDKKQLQNNFLSLFRSGVCFQQGEIAQHFLLGNEYHKALRLALDSRDGEKVRTTIKAIDRLHLTTLSNAWGSAVRHMGTYFSLTHKSATPPRFCIKGSKRNPHSALNSEKLIVDILREDGTRSGAECSVSANTGFSAVQDTGKYYFEPNIPEAVRIRNYRNPRLDPRHAAAYEPPRWHSRRFFRKGEDVDWIRCWDPNNHTPATASSCYKSTLIVPMTLLNNSLSEAFIEETYVGLALREDRSIYGFLCMDHPEVGFFNESDINLGYIFADLLSIYLITKDALMSHSAIYEKAKSFINGGSNGRQI